MINFSGIPTAAADAIRNGAPDANHQSAETLISDGNGNPCRQCLDMIKKNEPLLVFAHRPFNTVNPYTELGPVFLHKNHCEPYRNDAIAIPPALEDSDHYILRGYYADQRIVYGTGQVTPQNQIISYAQKLFERSEIQFIHVRSATNNCWQARIDR